MLAANAKYWGLRNIGFELMIGGRILTLSHSFSLKHTHTMKHSHTLTHTISHIRTHALPHTHSLSFFSNFMNNVQKSSWCVFLKEFVEVLCQEKFFSSNVMINSRWGTRSDFCCRCCCCCCCWCCCCCCCCWCCYCCCCCWFLWLGCGWHWELWHIFTLLKIHHGFVAEMPPRAGTKLKSWGFIFKSKNKVFFG